MIWEIDRYDWSTLRAMGSARGVPAALRALQAATSEEEAERAYWKIDNVVVTQGALFEAAAPTAACLVTMLPRCSGAALTSALELLVQLGAGEPDPSESAAGDARLHERCVREISRAVALYVDLLERGDDGQRASCVDLLGICARQDATLREQVRFHLERMLAHTSGEGLRALIGEWLAELPRSS